MKRQTLALFAVSLAGLGSIATSQQVPGWSIDAQPLVGAPLILVAGTAGTASRHLTVGISAEAMDDDYTEGFVRVTADACFTAVAGTSGTAAPARLRVVLLHDAEQAAGQVLEQPLPLCPSRIAFPLQASIDGPCPADLPCVLGYGATFERLGEAAEVHVDWTATATVFDYGQDKPPAGATVTLTED